MIGKGKRSKKVRDKFSKIQKELWAEGKYANRKRRMSKYEVYINEAFRLKNLNLTQQEIGNLIGIPRRRVGDILLGKIKNDI